MNNVAIESASAAVTRNLQAIVERAGFAVREDAALRLLHTEDRLALAYAGQAVPLPCPIAPQALIAALAPPHRTTIALDHGWVFDATARCLLREAASYPLTEKESLLLGMLLAASPAATARDALLKHIWAYEADIETHTLETHIYRLRQKLEALVPRPCGIATAEGSYRLVMLNV